MRQRARTAIDAPPPLRDHRGWRSLPAWGRVAALGFVSTAVVHLGAQVVGAGTVVTVTQWLLMPLLAATFWSVASGWPVSLALGFSWLGDTVPALFSGDTRFLAMVGCFLCAQLAYIAAFLPAWRRSVLRRPAVVGYVAAFGALVVSCAPGAGGLLVPVICYGVCLTLMAVLATGVHPLTGIGGAVFLVSDGLIALDAFAPWYAPPAPGLWVMLTYVVGQALIVAGVGGVVPWRRVRWVRDIERQAHDHDAHAGDR
jgi:uncharacterized membrane protein YhhN